MEEEIFKKLIPQEKRDLGVEEVDSREQRFVDGYNKMKFVSSIYDCPVCGNKGKIAAIEEGKAILKCCKCYTIRRNRERLESFGLLDCLNDDFFKADYVQDEWLDKVKAKVLEYVEGFKNGSKDWFYIGGQVGCGKTNKCVYILNQIMTFFPDMSICYFNWDTRYKELIFNKLTKDELLDELKTIDLLYLDDFLRVPEGEKLSNMEREQAKSIIDYRYMNKLVTIISSEKFIQEIVNYDEAIGTRIRQMCGRLPNGKSKYALGILRNKDNQGKEDRNLRNRVFKDDGII